MNILDSVSEITALDSAGILESTGLFLDQCIEAWNATKDMQLSQEYTDVEHVVVCGMGGSRFTPKIVKELFYDQITKPYDIVDTYHLPRYVGSRSLVILSSYSGTTEEVLSCGLEAFTKGAKVMGVCRGGAIADMLKQNSSPSYFFSGKNNPCGQPRIGGGYLLMAHIGFLKSLGFLAVSQEDIDHAITEVRAFGQHLQVEVPTEKNPAKLLALQLHETHPIIIGAEFTRGVVNAVANQLNETAKLISDYRHIPELNHHLLEGLKNPSTLHESGLFVFLESPLYSHPILKRFKITTDIVQQQDISTHTIVFQGKSKLSQILETMILWGYATFYLAMLYNIDPVAIPWVDYLKQELSKESE